MVSSFFGLFTAQRALTTSQTAMNVVSNNIANANTPGYSRQSIQLKTSSSYPQPIVGTQTLPGTFGTGVEIESITRTRDSFLDAQYRVEASTYGHYQQKQWAMENVEGILAEPSDAGILSKIDQFFSAAQDLSLNPESLSVRTSFVQQAVDLSVVMNQQAAQLQELRETLVGNEGDLTSVQQSKLGMYTVEVNSKLESLAHVNSEIITLKGNGVEPNDLLDTRDKILDDLSKLIPITIIENTNGSVNVSLGANALVTGAVVDNTLSVQNSGNINDPADVLLSGPPIVNVNADINSGICGGLLEMGGNDPTKITVYDMIQNLDTLASEIATQINALQAGGRHIDSATGQLVTSAGTFPDLFIGGPPITAGNIAVDQNLIDDPNRVSAALITAANDEVGSSGQVLAMAQLRNAAFAALGNATFNGFQSSNVSALGVQAKSVDDFVDSQGTLVNQIDLRRESVSGVSIDEELVDLIRYQRAFEASSRVMSTMNDILDVLINRMV